jgi:hypothetical protein
LTGLDRRLVAIGHDGGDSANDGYVEAVSLTVVEQRDTHLATAVDPHRAWSAVDLKGTGAALREYDETSPEESHDVIAIDVDGRAFVDMQRRAVTEQHLRAASFGSDAVTDHEGRVRFGGFAPALPIQEHLAVDHRHVRRRRSGLLGADGAGSAKHKAGAKGGHETCHWTYPTVGRL